METNDARRIPSGFLDVRLNSSNTCWRTNSSKRGETIMDVKFQATGKIVIFLRRQGRGKLKIHRLQKRSAQYHGVGERKKNESEDDKQVAV